MAGVPKGWAVNSKHGSHAADGMSGEIPSSPHPIQNALPDEVQALFFACDCFGLGLKDFADDKDDKEKLHLSREKLRRARLNKSILPDEREQVRQRLFQRLRRAAHLPTGGMSSFVTHELATVLLQLYGTLRPALFVSETDSIQPMWILAEHVFLPTAYLIVQTRHRWGLGSELREGECWYLPEKLDGKTRTPIQRVLDYWLRTAGFRTASGVGGNLESRKKAVSRWLKGKSLPTLSNLHGLAAKFQANSGWLDDFDSWKARFKMACAMQRLWKAVDTTFGPAAPQPALLLANAYRKIAGQMHFEDDEGVFADPKLFFAVRLILARLEAQGILTEIVAQAPQTFQRSFGPEVPHSEIEEWRTKVEWERKPGNWIVAYLHKLATSHRQSLREYIVARGVAELNELIKRQKVGRV